MNTSSRFSVLYEVDLDSAHRIKGKAKVPKDSKEAKDESKFSKTRKEPNNKINVKPKLQEKIQPKNNKQNGALPTNIKKKKEEADLQALAFGFGKKNKKGNNKNTEKEKIINKKGKSNQTVNGVKEEDDWRKRDEEFVKDQNEKSLREAILQSKLEFEEQKKIKDEILTSEVEEEKTVTVKGNKNKKKKDKPLTLSLDQFNNLQANELANLKEPIPPATTNKIAIKKPQIEPQKIKEEKFFKDVDEATRRTIEKEHRQEEYKVTVNKANQELQVKKFISEIEKRDFEIQALRLEVDSLRSKLEIVKTKNKKLCEVISSSELRSKGELVVELEKATKGRDEFSEEIARITAELEQERTKVSQLTSELKKLQGKKRNADSSSK